MKKTRFINKIKSYLPSKFQLIKLDVSSLGAHPLHYSDAQGPACWDGSTLTPVPSGPATGFSSLLRRGCLAAAIPLLFPWSTLFLPIPLPPEACSPHSGLLTFWIPETFPRFKIQDTRTGKHYLQTWDICVGGPELRKGVLVVVGLSET